MISKNRALTKEQKVKAKELKDKFQKIVAKDGDFTLKSNLLKGLIFQIKQQNCNQQKMMEQSEFFHRKNPSSSTNLSIDNFLSISQANSVQQDTQRKKEFFETMKENYSKQLVEREQALIKLKKERYVFSDHIEDLQHELAQQRKILTYLENRNTDYDKEIQKLMDRISNAKNKQKEQSRQIIQTPKLNQSMSASGNSSKYSLSRIKGLFQRNNNRNILDDNFEKLSTRTVVQRSIQNSTE